MISLKSVAEQMISLKAIESLKSIYGNDTNMLYEQQKRFVRLKDLFQSQFPEHSKGVFFSTPGRTEIGGNHTDHQNGRVLCAAVNLDILALAAPNQDNTIRLKSEEFEKMDVINLSDLGIKTEEKEHSAALIRGIAAAFCNRGYKIGGLDIYTTSCVPKGSGLSSSAAFEILVSTIIDYFYNNNSVSPVERAMMSQYAENEYFGKPSGLMDQCGCSVGGIISIDFAKKEKPLVESLDIDFNRSGYGLVITNTGGSHADLTGEYAAIPTEMRSVASFFGKSVLREIDPKLFWEKLGELKNNISERAVLRAIHFFEDNQRVVEQVSALKNEDFISFLTLINNSGISSWTQLQNVWSIKSVSEQPVALALSLSKHLLDGRGACRVHGGGFAGTIQAFVPLDIMENYLYEMRKVFGNDQVSELNIRNKTSCMVELN